MFSEARGHIYRIKDIIKKVNFLDIHNFTTNKKVIFIAEISNKIQLIVADGYKICIMNNSLGVISTHINYNLTPF